MTIHDVAARAGWSRSRQQALETGSNRHRDETLERIDEGLLKAEIGWEWGLAAALQGPGDRDSGAAIDRLADAYATLAAEMRRLNSDRELLARIRELLSESQ